jgi:hypothetical protein
MTTNADHGLTELKNVIFNDPLSETSRKIRTRLLFVAALTVLIHVYQLKIKSLPWLNVEVPENAPHMLEGALAATLAYFLVVYSLYAWHDIQRWLLGGRIISLKAVQNNLGNQSQYLYRIQDHLGKITNNRQHEPMFDIARKLTDEALVEFPKILGILNSMETQRRRLSILQWIRLVGIELVIPIGLGLLAMSKVWAALPSLLLAIAQS